MTVLSVVIPTRDRVQTAVRTVDNVLRCAGADVEIIVQDCGTSHALRKHIERVADARLHYKHTVGPLSMTENWNRAAKFIQGEYAVFIGDDDGVLPEIGLVAQWAKANKIAAVAYRAANYFWRDYPGPRSGHLFYKPPYTGKCQPMEAGVALKAALRINAGSIVALPQLYHGIVATEHLLAISGRHGKLFDAVHPDYYVAWALAHEIADYIHIDYPLTVVGSSARSNTSPMRHRRARIGRHLSEYQDNVWPDMLPIGFAHVPECLTAATMITAAQDHWSPEDVRDLVVLAPAYAACIVDSPVRARELLRLFVRNVERLGRDYRKELGEIGRQLALRIGARVYAQVQDFSTPAMYRRRGYTVQPAEDIVAAVDRLSANIPDARSALLHAVEAEHDSFEDSCDSRQLT